MTSKDENYRSSFYGRKISKTSKVVAMARNTGSEWPEPGNTTENESMSCSDCSHIGVCALLRCLEQRTIIRGFIKDIQNVAIICQRSSNPPKRVKRNECHTCDHQYSCVLLKELLYNPTLSHFLTVAQTIAAVCLKYREIRASE